MPVPGARMEFQIGGQWVDVTADVRAAGTEITHARGRREGAVRVDPGAASFTVASPGGKYSNRNPNSPNFGLLGRNTPARMSVAGPSYLRIADSSGDRASTPDHASLDITGDLDIRVEARLDDWGTTTATCLIGKYDTASNQRSYRLVIQNGFAYLAWSTTGTDVLERSSTTLPIPLSRRLALRVTLDVDNGSTGHTVTFYTSDTINGTWVQLGTPTVTAGVTSVFASTAPLDVGQIQSLTYLAPVGQIAAAQIRNGIGGTVVANPNFTTQAAGAGSFVDSAGRTWTVAGNATIADRWYRFLQAIPEWPPSWHASGNDVRASLQAAGTLRRMGQGTKALDSTLRRRIPSGSPNAYWPMEEDRDATHAYSPIAKVAPLKVKGLSFGADDSLYGSSALPTIKGPASIAGRVPRTNTQGWHVEAVYNLPTLPPTMQQVMRVQVAGTGLFGMASAVVLVSTAAVRVEIRDPDDALVAYAEYTDPRALADFAGVWNRLQIFTADADGQTYVAAAWRDVVANTYWYARTVYSGSPGRATDVTASWGSALDGMAVGHVAVWNGVSGTITPPAAGVTTYESADSGFSGESAVNRLRRLAAEERLPLALYDGDPTVNSELMGPQRPNALLTLLEECAESDMGFLYEDRESTGLVYRDRSSLYNQRPVLTVPYGQLAPPLEPVDDDRAIRNDVTVHREGGSSGRVVIEDGPLSVQQPPAGVGIYDESVSVSLHTDDQPVQIAGWRAHLGTWDEARYPSVRLFLHKYPALIPQVLKLDVGDIIRITDLPPFLPPGPLDLMVQGYQENIGPLTWDLTLFCSPAGPWNIGVVDDAVLGRADTDGSTLSTAATASATALEVHSDVGPVWTTTASDFPMDLRVGGEVVTAVTVTNRTDTFTRTLSNTWGTSSSGHLWTEVGAVAADRSVDGARGVLTLSAPVPTIRFQMTVGDIADCEVRCRMSAGQVSTGSSMLPAVLLRYVNGSDYYRARLHFGTSGAMYASVTRGTTQVGGTTTLSYTYAAGTEFEVRVLLTGHRVQMRVWPVGTEEPTVWHHEGTVTTNTIASGAVGVTASAFAENTNVNPQARFDSFQVVNPQRFTVTRSVNGIAKAHPAGTDVRLAQPTIVAL
ncbi:hypothetical protein [Streptomyces flavidovirens]|uniref:hypothetical protein n=1 Tax=Streptomyces flavidovirens TaxID=67298 RepID=UPI00041FEEBF|nr:hypothetical protein [Streptomyces flavidovirens]